MAFNRKQLVFFFASFFAAAFVLNFCWESWHGLLYKDHKALAASRYVPMMVRMAFMDALSVIGIYLFTSLFSGRVVWYPGERTLVYFLLAGTVPAYLVEYYAVNVLFAWAYTPSMPLVFRVGLTPLVQLPLTGLLSLMIALRHVER
jgi:hypothetical protein